MKTKKSHKADLEKKRIFFFQIGLIVVLSLTLVAFEWQTAPKKHIEPVVKTGKPIVVILPPNTYVDKKVVPPKPKLILSKLEIRPEVEIGDDPIFTSPDEIPYGNLLEFQFGDGTEKNVEDSTFVRVQEMPSFRGGDIKTFRDYVMKELVYPEKALINIIEGKVFLSFVVNKHGSVENVQVVKSIHPLLSDEAIRVVRNSPKWKPGKQRDKAVNVSFVIPITFDIR